MPRRPSLLWNDGDGLARLDFIINTSIRIHPRALLEYDALDHTLRRHIDKIIAGYPGSREFYVAKLAEGISTIATALYPKPVIVRLSDAEGAQASESPKERSVEIRVDDLYKAFGDREVLRGVDPEVYRGDVLAIVGGSGCGKTVLLNRILGQLGPFEEFEASNTAIIRPYFEQMPILQLRSPDTPAS